MADGILNNRPPDVKNDFGITDEEDKLDRMFMPDTTEDMKQNKRKAKSPDSESE